MRIYRFYLIDEATGKRTKIRSCGHVDDAAASEDAASTARLHGQTCIAEYWYTYQYEAAA
jgi:hypothetical protein